MTISSDPGQNWAVRRAELPDAPQIAVLFAQARRTAMPWLPELHTGVEDLAFFSNHVLPKQAVEVATHGASILGFSAWADGWVNHLYVAPPCWGKGIGSDLLTRIMAQSAQLQLWVFQRNTAAQAFYAAKQFVEVQRTDGARNEERCPDIRMQWTA